jgi:hypothetical protein
VPRDDGFTVFVDTRDVEYGDVARVRWFERALFH